MNTGTSIRRARTLFAAITWLMAVLMALTPTTVTLADAFEDAAQQGQAFGRDQIPDAASIFQQSGSGYSLSTGDGQAVYISPDDVFGQGPGTKEDLENIWGDNHAITEKTNSVMNQLQTSSTPYGQAFRVLKSSSQRAHPDLTQDSVFDTSREVMTEIFDPNGEFSACEVARKVTEADPIKTTLHDYKSCNRVPQMGDDCQVKHEYVAGVIKHESGPLNIQTCGEGCLTVWLGRVGDNYWSAGLCGFFEHNLEMRVLNPDAITDAYLDYVKWDDYMRVWINGEKVATYPNDWFPTSTTESCELSTTWSRDVHVDVTRFFKNAEPGHLVQFKMKVAVSDKGEGYARMRIHFNPNNQITKDDWTGLDEQCQAKLDALNSGFASGGVSCTDMPEASGGCTTIGYTHVCESDFRPSPFPGISPLCREVNVHSDLDFNRGQMECWIDPQGEQHCPVNDGSNPDTCVEYENDPQCKFLSSQCIDGASDDQGNCYGYLVRYDCGHEVEVPTYNETSTYTCPGGVRCMGSDCISTTEETNHDFAHAVAALQAADYMAMDMTCPTDQENNIDVNTCTVFDGEDAYCRTAMGGWANCCDTPGSGVSLAAFITMLSKTRKLTSLLTSDGGALHGAWTKIAEPVSNAWGSVTSYFSSATDTNAAATPAHMLGVEQLEQYAMKKTANYLVQTFGEGTAELFFESSGGSVASVASTGDGTLSLGGPIGGAMSMVMMAYTIYVIADLLVNLIWKCTEDEFALGAKRELKSAHHIGGFCKTEVLSACIEYREVYCTFNSPLSRILQEQIRAQLGISWGSPKHPDCRALTVAEIERTDWDRINLDDWLAILQTTGHMPQSPEEALEMYSLDELTKNTETLNFDGQRANTAVRNQQRLEKCDPDDNSPRCIEQRQGKCGDDDPHCALNRNEELRQALWNGDEGSGQATTNPPEPPNRTSPCHPGTRVYNYTGDTQYFTVPNRCRRLDVKVVGADSGGADNLPSREGQVKTNRLVVNSGWVLPINVGRGGGVDSFWDEARNMPAYIGLKGEGSGLYNTEGGLWIGAGGASQAGPVSQRAAHYWNGKNGYVVIQWGPNAPAPDPSQLPQHTPAPVPSEPKAPAPLCEPGSRTFNFTGSMQSFTMPEGCGHLVVTVDGAGGGGGKDVDLNRSTRGGAGARVSGTLSVSPGQKLQILVGQGGGISYGRYQQYDSNFNLYWAYSYAGGGGGRSEILSSGSTLVIAGGGGGGSGAVGLNGAHGGLNGQDAEPVYMSTTPARGGTQTSGGSGERYLSNSGRDGGRGFGGDSGIYFSDEVMISTSGNAFGGGGASSNAGVPGGGSGFYGGGGGAVGPGAGGSSFIDLLQNASVTTGGGSEGGYSNQHGQNGKIVLQWKE